VPFPRPRSFEIMATREVFDLANAIKLDIVGAQMSMAKKAGPAVQMAAQ
jgi:NitT/TauT family transport system ATP-binding protein